MATIPTVQVWSTGQYVTSSQMNAGVGNVLSWLMAPPRAIIYRTASVSWANSASPSVASWNTELVDTDTMWTSGHPSRLVANTAGLFAIEAAFHFPQYATGASQCGIALNSNGSWPSTGNANRLQETTLPAVSSFGQSMSLSFSYFLSVGDYIELFAAQNSGSSQTAYTSGTYFDAHIGARWLSSS